MKGKQNSLRKKRPITRTPEIELIRWKKNHYKTILELVEVILKDAQQQLRSYSYTDYTRDLITLRQRYSAEGISFVTHTLPQFHSNFLRWFEHGKSDYPGFKLKPGLKYPRFLSGLLKPIYENGTERTLAFRLFYQVCVAFKKIEGPYSKSVLSKELLDFVKVDDELGRVNYNAPHVRHITEHARAIITRIFKDVDPSDHPYALPHPGSGATNTKVEKHMRYEPHVLYEQIDDVFPYDEWFYSHPWDVVVKARDYMALVANKRLYPTSKQLFIHKKVGQPRGICKEENETQFMQQAVKTLLYKHIEAHPETKGRVNFSSQDVNRILSLISSTNRTKATLDFSKASDLVLREGVFILFRDTDLLNALDAVSTRFIELTGDGNKHPLLCANKYAPMGSGVCFPIMAMMHFALIKAIILESNLQNRFRLAKEVYVYGDDVIIPSQCVTAVYDWLPEFGMRINTEKSFYKSDFRESCGLHALAGHEVTPVYFQSIPHFASQTKDTRLLLSLISKEHLLQKRDMCFTAEYIRKRCFQLFGSLPRVHEDSPLLGWKSTKPVPLHRVLPYLDQRAYDCDTQCFKYRARIVHNVTDDDEYMETRAAYLCKLVSGKREAAFVKGDTTDLRVRWVTLYQSAIH